MANYRPPERFSSHWAGAPRGSSEGARLRAFFPNGPLGSPPSRIQRPPSLLVLENGRWFKRSNVPFLIARLDAGSRFWTLFGSCRDQNEWEWGR
ncbi:hypothetical protein AVEN_235569-1 [Araneus ventricosus]|uniref:Uncharacterized protein n=1 Tax=Araneus ventricosus TaxID=182803 RepID=A0A4Y2BTL0_ARAVE|nr:hypothetical protein AVEN_235569-1 [Araneus ventricosus]